MMGRISDKTGGTSFFAFKSIKVTPENKRKLVKI